MCAEDGTVLKWVGTDTEIWHRKRAEERRDLLLANARRANTVKRTSSLLCSAQRCCIPLMPVLLAASAMESYPHVPQGLRADIIDDSAQHRTRGPAHR